MARRVYLLRPNSPAMLSQGVRSYPARWEQHVAASDIEARRLARRMGALEYAMPAWSDPDMGIWKRAAAAAWSAWLVVGVSACSGESDAGPPLTVDEYITAAGDALCNRFVRCGELASMEVCRTGGIFPLVSLAEIDSLRAAFAAGRATFDGEKARACVDALVASACDQETSGTRTSPLACLQVARGTAHGGEPCAVDAECVSQFCNQAFSSCDNACCLAICGGDIPPDPGEGKPCLSDTCGDGLYCAGSAPGTCRRLVAAGAPCSPAEECDYGYRCDVENGSRFVCLPVPRLGEPCTGICRELGTMCDPTTNVCVPLSKPGDPCDQFANPLACGGFNQCDATGHCAPSAPVGVPCTSVCASPNQYCSIPAGSTTGTCQLLAKANEACAADIACASQHCDVQTHTCAPSNACP